VDIPWIADFKLSQDCQDFKFSDPFLHSQQASNRLTTSGRGGGFVKAFIIGGFTHLNTLALKASDGRKEAGTLEAHALRTMHRYMLWSTGSSSVGGIQGTGLTSDALESSFERLHQGRPEVGRQVLQECKRPDHIGHGLGVKVVYNRHCMLHTCRQPSNRRLVGQGGTRQQGYCQSLQSRSSQIDVRSVARNTDPFQMGTHFALYPIRLLGFRDALAN
jgi:hypothetical protein